MSLFGRFDSTRTGRPTSLPVGPLLLGLSGHGRISFPSQKRRKRMLFHRIAFHRVEEFDAIGQRGVKGIQRFAESTGAFAG